jgi:hypothetical protein
VVTFGEGHEVFYINGVTVYDWNDVPGTIVTLAANPINLVIGQDLPTSQYTTNANSQFYVNYGGYFIGALDEIRIYNSILSPGQVQSIYTLEKP